MDIIKLSLEVPLWGFRMVELGHLWGPATLLAGLHLMELVLRLVKVGGNPLCIHIWTGTYHMGIVEGAWVLGRRRSLSGFVTRVFR